MTINAISFPNLNSGDAGLSGSVAGSFSSVSIFKSALHILALCLSGHVVEIVISQLEDRKHKAFDALPGRVEKVFSRWE